MFYATTTTGAGNTPFKVAIGSQNIVTGGSALVRTVNFALSTTSGYTGSQAVASEIDVNWGSTACTGVSPASSGIYCGGEVITGGGPHAVNFGLLIQGGGHFLSGIIFDGTGTGPTQQGELYLGSYSNAAINATGQTILAANFTVASDGRLKTGVVPSKRGLDVLRQIKVKEYNYTQQAHDSLNLDNTRRYQGFIAQDLYSIYPDAVKPGIGDDPTKNYWGIDYDRLTPLLTRAVQELDTKVTQLQQQINTLKAKGAK